MSWVIAAPEYVAAAANDLAGIADTLGSANAAAAFPTGAVLAAGADEVSVGIAAMFGAHAQAYQAISQQAALFHSQFVQLMSAGAGQYAETEALNALPMQPSQGVTSSGPSATPLSSTPGAAAAQASAPSLSSYAPTGGTVVSAAPAAAAAGGTGLLPGAGVTGSAVAAPAAGGRHGGATLAAAFDTDVDADAASSGLGGAGGMVFGPGALGANGLGGVAAPAAASGGAASGGHGGGDAGHGQAVGSHNAWMYGNPEAVTDVPVEAAPVASTGHGGLYQGGSGFYGHGAGSAEASGMPAVTPL
jgi:PE family